MDSDDDEDMKQHVLLFHVMNDFSFKQTSWMKNHLMICKLGLLHQTENVSNNWECQMQGNISMLSSQQNRLQ